MVTRWGSTFALVERVIKLEAPLKLMFEDEFRHRTSANQPTLLESFVLTNDDFDGLRAILHVLKPLSLAQKALEGDQYVNISLVPLLYTIFAFSWRSVRQLQTQLLREICPF